MAPRSARRHAAVLACLAVVLLASGCRGAGGAASSAPADASPVQQYVAIGDSYAAGSLIPTTDVANGCFRSDHNYPSLVAKALHAKLVDRTCSGADSSDFTKSQYPDVPPQRTALDADTDLVTVGLGGNDQDVFASLIQKCPALESGDPSGAPCRAFMSAGGKDVLLEHLRATTGRLTKVLDEVHRRAPHAEVLAVGYPQIVDPTNRCSELPLSKGDYAYAAAVNKALSDTVRKAAAASGSTYVDVWSASRGHDICSDDPWVNGATNVRDKAPRYHPFAAEHAAVAKLIVSMLGANE